LGERLLCKQEVVGSIPSGSTSRGCGSFAKKMVSHPSSAAKASCGCVISDIVKR
jgi:hypothetical protein